MMRVITSKSIRVSLKHVSNAYLKILIFILLIVIDYVKAFVDVSEFTKFRQDYKVVTSSTPRVARSLIDCSQACAKLRQNCGFNFHQSEKGCVCFFEADVFPADYLPANGYSVYIKKTCVEKQELPSSTTSVPSSSSITSKPSSSSTTSMSLSPSCIADAMLCLIDNIYVFSGTDLHLYSNMSELVRGSNSTQTLSSVFNGISTAIAAYSDSSTIFIITETSVRLYSKTGFQFLKSKTWATHFGSDAIKTIDDVIYTYLEETFIFSGEDLFIISKNGKMETTRLDNNGAHNRYKTANSQDKPTNVTAACEIDSDRHLFVSNGTLYQFRFSDTIWTVLGKVVC